MDIQGTASLQGATSKDIQFHYDLSREFYAKWLDETMTYSAALFNEGDTLESAQQRKLDFHIRQAEIMPHNRVLDIGCGWGSLMFRTASSVESTECVGLTLSADQKSYIDEAQDDQISVLLKDWNALDEISTFDAVVSIGAFEHFASPEMSSEQKIAVYRAFFKKIQQVLKPGKCLSLQTIVFDGMNTADFPDWITDRIFPGSILPRPQEILAAADGIMSLEVVRNDALDYGRTCREWVNRIQSNKDDIISIVGKERTNEYTQYLRMSAVAFERKEFGLFRLKLRTF